jgi:two-component system chemotaxis response regulator CheB
MLESVPGVVVVGYACDGEEGLRKAIDLKPDLITLDLEMPRLDGFAFLRILMQKRPTPVIVVSSRSDDENVFKALDFGAVEFVAKPSARVTPELYNIQDDLVRKVAGIAGIDRSKLRQRTPTPSPRADAAKKRLPLSEGRFVSHVVIGASTGGPPALQQIFSALQQPIPVAFALAQHMPPGFTKAFADRLNKFSALEIREACSGDLLTPGLVLVAPGGKNLVLRRRGGDVVAYVLDPEPEQRYTPAVDVLFSSAGEIFGPRLLGVVLTGMGNDGARGVVSIKTHGGQTLAEAESSSVVFGMPKEAAATGKVDKVVPLPLMCREILRRCGY